MEVSMEWKKWPHEVEELSPDEFARCLALMQVKGSEEKAAYEAAKAKSKTGSRGSRARHK